MSLQDRLALAGTPPHIGKSSDGRAAAGHVWAISLRIAGAVRCPPARSRPAPGELLKTAAGIAMVSDNAPSLRPRLVRQVQAASQAGAFLQAVADGGVWPISARRRHPHGVNQAAVAGEQVAVRARQLGQQRLTGARALVDRLAQRARLRADIGPSTAAGITWLLMDPLVCQWLTANRLDGRRPARTAHPKHPAAATGTASFRFPGWVDARATGGSSPGLSASHGERPW